MSDNNKNINKNSKNSIIGTCLFFMIASLGLNLVILFGLNTKTMYNTNSILSNINLTIALLKFIIILFLIGIIHIFIVQKDYNISLSILAFFLLFSILVLENLIIFSGYCDNTEINSLEEIKTYDPISQTIILTYYCTDCFIIIMLLVYFCLF